MTAFNTNTVQFVFLLVTMLCGVNYRPQPVIQPLMVTSSDTLRLFHKDSSFNASAKDMIISCPLPGSSFFKVKGKTLLLLHQPRVINYPEGVYELYISREKPSAGSFKPSSQNFITLLDLYALSSPGAPKQLEIDISAVAGKLVAQNDPAPGLFISLHFGPVKKKHGSLSTKGGCVQFSGLSIVQVK